MLSAFFPLSSFTDLFPSIPSKNIVLFKKKKTYPCDNLHNMLMLICNETSGWHFNISFSFKQLETTQMVETILRALL